MYTLAHDRPGIRQRRRLWVAAVLLLALAAASAPYLYGALIRPPGTHFWAVPPINSSDANPYLAWTRATAEGAVLLGDAFTTEPHRPRLFLPQALVQGWIARAGGGDPLIAFQVMRVLGGSLLLGAGWWFGRLLLPVWRQRRLYLGFLGFSAGASWWLERAGLAIPSGDLLQPEANTLFSLANLPHLPFSAALLTALFATRITLEREASGRRRWSWLAITALIAGLLSWTHPFDFVQLGIGLACYGIIRSVTERRLSPDSVHHAAAVLTGALPGALYLVRLTAHDPVYAALAADTMQVQSWPFYAIAHLPLGLLALLVLTRRDLRHRYALALCWAAGAFLFLTLPLDLGGKQARVIGGVHVPLAVLATAGAHLLAERVARRSRGGPARRRRLAAVMAAACLLVTVPSALGIVVRHAREYRRQPQLYYLPSGLRAVYAELERAGDDSQVTLAGPLTGGWAPALADTRSFQGHWHMTLAYPVKAAAMRWFFQGAANNPNHASADSAMRAAWLRAQRITWVIWYPAEWTAGGRTDAVPPNGVPGLVPALVTRDATLYRLTTVAP